MGSNRFTALAFAAALGAAACTDPAPSSGPDAGATLDVGTDLALDTSPSSPDRVGDRADSGTPSDSTLRTDASLDAPADRPSGVVGVACGATSCPVGQRCCRPRANAVEGRCLDPSAPCESAGADVACDGPEDCARGETCCVSLVGGTRSTCVAAAMCPTFGRTSFVACQRVDDCPAEGGRTAVACCPPAATSPFVFNLCTDAPCAVGPDAGAAADAGADVPPADVGMGAMCGEARCTPGLRCVDGVCVGGDGTMTQRSCPTSTERGCGMVRVEGGTFTMGADVDCRAAPADPACAEYATPSQPDVRVDAFAIDAYEVTVARFRRFWAAGAPAPAAPVAYRGGLLPFVGEVQTEAEIGDHSEANFARTDREDHPMNMLEWATAQAFCVWDGGRLPTQAEWEFAARGTEGRRYPWGDAEPTYDLACTEFRTRVSCPVGSLAAGAVRGLFDLAGNVSEWNADWGSDYARGGSACWNGTATRNPLCINPASDSRVSHGGGYWIFSRPNEMRNATRRLFTPHIGSPVNGVRCARDLP